MLLVHHWFKTKQLAVLNSSQNKEPNGARIERKCLTSKKWSTRIYIINKGTDTLILRIISMFLGYRKIKKKTPYAHSKQKPEDLTIISEGVIQQLEKWEAVPGVLWLCLKCWIHINRIKRQKLLCMLSQQFWPPSECLQMWQNRITNTSCKGKRCIAVMAKYIWICHFTSVLFRGDERA